MAETISQIRERAGEIAHSGADAAGRLWAQRCNTLIAAGAAAATHFRDAARGVKDPARKETYETAAAYVEKLFEVRA